MPVLPHLQLPKQDWADNGSSEITVGSDLMGNPVLAGCFSCVVSKTLNPGLNVGQTLVCSRTSVCVDMATLLRACDEGAYI